MITGNMKIIFPSFKTLSFLASQFFHAVPLGVSLSGLDFYLGRAAGKIGGQIAGQRSGDLPKIARAHVELKT